MLRWFVACGSSVPCYRLRSHWPWRMVWWRLDKCVPSTLFSQPMRLPMCRALVLYIYICFDCHFVTLFDQILFYIITWYTSNGDHATHAWLQSTLHTTVGILHDTIRRRQKVQKNLVHIIEINYAYCSYRYAWINKGICLIDMHLWIHVVFECRCVRACIALRCDRHQWEWCVTDSRGPGCESETCMPVKSSNNRGYQSNYILCKRNSFVLNRGKAKDSDHFISLAPEKSINAGSNTHEFL